MRRPILIVLFAQCAAIIILLEGFGLQLYDTGFNDYYDTVQTIQGIVKSVQLKKDYSAITVDLGNENILLRLKNITDENFVFDMVGRTISATGKITKPDSKRNPRPV